MSNIELSVNTNKHLPDDTIPLCLRLKEKFDKIPKGYIFYEYVPVNGNHYWVTYRNRPYLIPKEKCKIVIIDKKDVEIGNNTFLLLELKRLSERITALESEIKQLKGKQSNETV